MRLRPGLALLLVVFAPSAARAQLCVGTAPFSAGPVRLAGAMNFTDGAKQFGGMLDVGAAQGLFAGANASRISFDDFSETAMVYGVHAGFAVPVGTSQKAQMCPIVSLGFNDGPDLDFFGSPAELSGRQLGLGFSLGGIVSSTPSLDVVPFATIAYIRSKADLTFGGSTETTNDDNGLLALGVGFVLSRMVTIQPNIAFPLGEEDSDPSYGIALMVNLGRRK